LNIIPSFKLGKARLIDAASADRALELHAKRRGR
jgi:hypothetical protein